MRRSAKMAANACSFKVYYYYFFNWSKKSLKNTVIFFCCDVPLTTKETSKEPHDRHRTTQTEAKLFPSSTPHDNSPNFYINIKVDIYTVKALSGGRLSLAEGRSKKLHRRGTKGRGRRPNEQRRGLLIGRWS